MKLQWKITFSTKNKVVAEITGREEGIDAGNFTVAEVVEKVGETEKFLEKLTGLRVDIEQIS